MEGPLLAGMRVLTADRGGTIRESLAMGKVYAAARHQQGQSELLDALVASPPALDPSRVQAAGDVGKASAEGLKAAKQVLQEKATSDELEAYRGFVREVAGAVARAQKEGGVLGVLRVGCKDVSPEEQAALDEIEAVLA